MERMIFDYSKLRGRIKEIYNTEGAFAKEMGISKGVLSAKLLNKKYFRQDEILNAAELLELNPEELMSLFLCKKS